MFFYDALDIFSISLARVRYDEKLFIDWPFPSCFIGYTTLHDRNDNSTPPSVTTQMSYLQMNSLRNGSNASSGTTGNQTSIYPMLKEENSSSSGNNSAINYASLSDLSVSSRFDSRARTFLNIFSSPRITALHINRHQACMMTNRRTISHFSNRRPILKARPSSTLAWVNPSTYRPRTTREATESTREFHVTEVDLVITTMNLRLTRGASNSNKYQEARRHQRPLPATSNRDRVNGIRRTTPTTPTSTLLITTRRCRTRTMATTASSPSWLS